MPQNPDKTQTEIPYSVLEYTANFKKPILEAWTVPVKLITAVLSALDPFGFKLDGVESNTRTEKLSEYSLLFRRNPPGVTFSVRLGKLVVVADNLDWTEAGQFITAMDTGVKALLAAAGAEIQSHYVALSMHIQPKVKRLNEITAPLSNSVALKLLDGEVKFQGIILRGEKSHIVIDESVAYANGLFVRIGRGHPPGATLQQMADVLHGDEERLFDVLGLEGDL